MRVFSEDKNGSADNKESLAKELPMKMANTNENLKECSFSSQVLSSSEDEKGIQSPNNRR